MTSETVAGERFRYSARNLRVTTDSADLLPGLEERVINSC
jgi:hypothetical protein